MGASQSTVKSVTDIVQEVARDIVSSNTASCTAAASAQQSMRFDGISGGAGCNINMSNMGQKMKLEVNLNCVQNQGNSADLDSKFNAAIDKKIKSESEAGMGFGNSGIDSTEKIKQSIKTNIKMSSVASCLASSFGKQEIVVKDVKVADCVVPVQWDEKGRPTKYQRLSDGITIKDIQQDLVVKATAKCVQDQMNAIKDVADMKTSLKSDMSSTAKGTDIMPFVYLAICLALLAFLFYFGKPLAAILGAVAPPPGSAYNVPPSSVINAAKAFARKR